MTLTGNLSDNLAQSNCVHNDTSNFNILYCSHLWSNSDFRHAIINPSSKDNKLTKYCYTCRGKIRNYGVTPQKEHFLPNNHSTPRVEPIHERIQTGSSEFYKNYLDDSYTLDNNLTGRKASINDININNLEITHYIPTISRQVDSNSIRHKYTSEQYEQCENEESQRRLSKSLSGIRCVVNWSLTESPKKRRTQIQACSISVMIIAIIVISLVLVNLTNFNNFNNIKNYTSTSLVPTENINITENSSAIVNYYTDLTVPQNDQIMVTDPTTPVPLLSTTKNNSLISNVIFKIRKNIKTYPKDEHKRQENIEQKIYSMKNSTQTFCLCQSNEVCMLDEISGKSVCMIAVDIDDPTGCGGLCAMETEACHLVDKVRGVRVCRLLTQVSCSSQDWRCRNGFCVPSEARCDGYIQCYDRSDEMHCECDLTKQFRCGHSISCFSNKKICDGLIDCWDGYDELNCTMECPENQFTCTNGQCITSSRFCDGLADCSDKSDEPQGCDGACGTHEFQCNNHRCVPHGVQCDGRDDCGDGTDEFQCFEIGQPKCPDSVNEPFKYEYEPPYESGLTKRLLRSQVHGG